jgi:protein gp37
MGIQADVKFISYEPALGPLKISLATAPQPDWIICGGESGPHARIMDPQWAMALRDQCEVWRVPFFMKQMARKAPIPDDLMVRQFPR